MVAFALAMAAEPAPLPSSDKRRHASGGGADERMDTSDQGAPYWKWQRVRVREELRQRYRGALWKGIQALAAALLRHETLSYGDAHDLYIAKAFPPLPPLPFKLIALPAEPDEAVRTRGKKR